MQHEVADDRIDIEVPVECTADGTVLAQIERHDMLIVLASEPLYDEGLACLTLSFHDQAFVVPVLPIDEPIIDLPSEHMVSTVCLSIYVSLFKINYCN